MASGEGMVCALAGARGARVCAAGAQIKKQIRYGVNCRNGSNGGSGLYFDR